MGRNRRAAPLMNDPAVKELLALMTAHNAPGQKDMAAMLQQIAGLEKQLDAAVEELAAMRKELAEAERRNHPMKHTLQKAVITMQAQVLNLRDRLGELKQAVVEGCKQTLAAFREHGVSALAHTADFFRIRPALEAVSRELDQSIAHDNKVIATITAASKEYHEAGRHLKNIVRAVRGQEPVAEPKGPGALAHTMAAPFKAELSLLRSMKGRTDGALKRLEHLEQAARPPIRQTMKEMEAKAAKEQSVRERYAVAVKPKER